MQIKHFTAQKSLEIALKLVQKDVKNLNSKKNNTTSTFKNLG